MTLLLVLIMKLELCSSEDGVKFEVRVKFDVLNKKKSNKRPPFSSFDEEVKIKGLIKKSLSLC